MNEKKAKRLRHQARALTVGKPWNNHTPPGRVRKLNPECGRAVYRRMKREASHD